MVETYTETRTPADLYQKLVGNYDLRNDIDLEMFEEDAWDALDKHVLWYREIDLAMYDAFLTMVSQRFEEDAAVQKVVKGLADRVKEETAPVF